MSQQQRILELVKNGGITVEQGMELMKALEDARPTSPRPPRPPVPPRPPTPAWTETSSAVRAVKVGRPLASGSGQLSFDQVVQLGIHGIKPGFIQEMRDAGIDDLSFNDIVQLGIHGIRPSFVIEMRRIGEEMNFAPLTTNQIVQLGIHGIKPNYVREMIASGALNFDTLRVGMQNMQEHRAKLEERRGKLEAKRDKYQASFETVLTERQREKLEEKLEEINDELEGLEEEMSDALEAQLEAELDAESDETEPSLSDSEVRTTSRTWFDINSTIDANLPADLRKAALEDALQTVSADLGVAETKADRAALTEVKKQIHEELQKLENQNNDNLNP
jgi:hypothetical protein